MRIPRTATATLLLCAAAAAPAAVPPGTLGPLSVRAASPEGRAFEAKVERVEHESGLGERVRILLTNPGSDPAEVTAVELAEPAVLAPLFEVSPTTRALSLDEAGDASFVRARVTPFRFPVSGGVGVGLARDDGSDVTILAVPRRPRQIRPSLSIVRQEDGSVRFDLRFALERAPLAAGETFALPDLVVLHAPTTRLALEALVGDAPPPDAREAPPDAPFALVPEGGDSLRLAFSRGVPLDLFQSDGAARVRRLAAGRLELSNPDAVARLVTLPTRECELDDRALLLLSRKEGGRFGSARGLLSFGLPPRGRSEISWRSVPAASPARFEVRAVRPAFGGRPAGVEAIDPESPDADTLVEQVLFLRGLLLVALEGGEPDETAPLPALVERRLGARVAVVAPRDVRRPEGEEEWFTRRAANVEWRVGIERATEPPARLLASPAAGHQCTPLDPFVADGLPAARGFYVPAAPGAALVFVDVPDGFLDDLGARLLDRGELWALFRAVGRARKAVRAEAQQAGLFGRIPLERIGPVDLTPGDPFSRSQYSIQVVPRRATVERRKTADGAWVADDVYRTAAPLVFAADFPVDPEDWVVGVVRRAPSRTLDGYRIEMGDRIVHRSTEGGDPADDGWIEEWFAVRRSDLARSQRMMVVLRPEGGVLPIARIGFRVYRPKPGTALSDLGDAVRTFGRVAHDRNAAGGWIAMGGDVWPIGHGLAPASGFEIETDGRFLDLLGRIGLDDAAPAEARATVVVTVDGAERFRLELDRERRGPFPLTAEVAGGRTIRLEVLPPPDSSPDALVDLLDARLVAE